MTSSRQTVSYLQRRFAEAGIHPDTKQGQNFLTDLNLLHLLVRSAELGPNDVVLEVGTGLGGLTGLLASQALAVVTVEIDRHLHQMASEELFQRDNVTMLRRDVLQNKNNIDPRVIDTVRERMDAVSADEFKLVANLPYKIATPLIANLLTTPIVPTSMTVTIQKELADRITAGPNTKDYGALSIWVQSLCDAQLVRVMPPTVFWPRPKVHSAIIRMIPREDKRAQIPDLAFYHQFVRALFFHRRKFLRSVVLSALKKQLDKTQVDKVLGQLDLAPDARAEQLDVPTVQRLAAAIRIELAAG